MDEYVGFDDVCPSRFKVAELALQVSENGELSENEAHNEHGLGNHRKSRAEELAKTSLFCLELRLKADEDAPADGLFTGNLVNRDSNYSPIDQYDKYCYNDSFPTRRIIDESFLNLESLNVRETIGTSGVRFGVRNRG